MVPIQFGPTGQMVPRIFSLSRGTSCDDLRMGTKFVGDHLSRGTKMVGDRLSRGTKLFGDQLSMGTKSGGPEVRGSNGFGTK